MKGAAAHGGARYWDPKGKNPVRSNRPSPIRGIEKEPVVVRVD